MALQKRPSRRTWGRRGCRVVLAHTHPYRSIPIIIHKADQPDIVVHFLDAEGLSGEDRAAAFHDLPGCPARNQTYDDSRSHNQGGYTNSPRACREMLGQVPREQVIQVHGRARAFKDAVRAIGTGHEVERFPSSMSLFTSNSVSW